jgi:predicted acetyltransferase
MTYPAIPSTVRKMKMPEQKRRNSARMSVPPEALAYGEIRLRFIRMGPGDEKRGFVPYYHFHILNPEGLAVGHIDFRVGDTNHVVLCAGHIGYEISGPFRGRGFAGQACRAIAPFVRSIYETVIITTNPDNFASIRTIEKLGADFIDEIEVAPHEPAYQSGVRRKKRFRWKP